MSTAAPRSIAAPRAGGARAADGGAASGARAASGGGLAAPPSAARAARFAWPLRVAVAGPPPLLASSSRISRLTWGARPIGVFLRTMRSPSARAAKSRPLGERGAFGGGSIAAVLPPTVLPGTAINNLLCT